MRGIAAFLCASVVLSAGPASATPRTTPFDTPLGSVTLTIDDRQRFTENACLFMPIQVVWRREPRVTVLGELTLAKPGTSIANEDSFVLVPGEPLEGEFEDYVYACPGDGAGVFVLGGRVTFTGPDDTLQRAVPQIPIIVSQARTRIRDLRIVRTATGLSVSGATTAGDAAAGGILLVAVRVPGATAWTNLALPKRDKAGAFRAAVRAPIPRGSLVRVEVRACKWCSGAHIDTRV